MLDFLSTIKILKKFDSMGVLEQDVIFSKFEVLQLHVMKLCYIPMKSMFG